MKMMKGIKAAMSAMKKKGGKEMMTKTEMPAGMPAQEMAPSGEPMAHKAQEPKPPAGAKVLARRSKRARTFGGFFTR